MDNICINIVNTFSVSNDETYLLIDKNNFNFV